MKERKELYNQYYLKRMYDKITDLATYIGEESGSGPGIREMTWHCFALFNMQKSKRANNILRNMILAKCHFLPMNFTQLLYKYGSQIDNDVKEKLIKYIKENRSSMMSSRIRISMYNDNFANMAIYTCLIAGEMFNDKEWFLIGLEKLKGVVDLFTRCGVLMEYGSPTYTPIDTLCFSEIARHVQNEEAKVMAKQCEKRMMIEIATHYHCETSLFAGPYSRAYAIDMVGHPHLLSGLLWLIFGDVVFINPIKYLFNPLPNQIMHNGLETLTLPNIAWILDTNYQIDDELINLALHKKYPYHVACRTECIPSNVINEPTDEVFHEYGGYQGTNTTYMTKNFTLGTGISQFHGGAMSESFYITYKNKEQAKKIEDVGVIYSRYIFNDKLPEQTNNYELFGNVDYTGFRDEGRKFCLQKNGEALVVYKPKQYERKNVTSAKLSVMIPCHFYDDFTILINENKVTSFPHTSSSFNTVYVLVNESYFAFTPLSFTNHGRQYAMTIEKHNNHIMINMFNYRGENRKFGLRETLLTTSGFLVTCKEKSDFNNFSDFVSYVNNGVITDYSEKEEGATARRITYKNEKIELNFKYSPMTESIFVNTVDKKPVDLIILEADELDKKKIPFIL
ncbi:MAG: hypothetical protein KAG94_04635 [Clostridiales bacterium]|nr:hypothetical protein [Clostridiales bacterium]